MPSPSTRPLATHVSYSPVSSGDANPGAPEGRITRAGETTARLLRDNVVAFEGKIASLRRFKDDVSEVKTGFECGIGFDKFNDIRVGDVIEIFAMERVLTTA